MTSPAPAWETLPATLTVEEVAKLLRLGRRKVYEEVHGGRIPSLKFGRKILIPTDRLRRHLDGQPA